MRVEEEPGSWRCLTNGNGSLKIWQGGKQLRVNWQLRSRSPSAEKQLFSLMDLEIRNIQHGAHLCVCVHVCVCVCACVCVCTYLY